MTATTITMIRMRVMTIMTAALCRKVFNLLEKAFINCICRLLPPLSLLLLPAIIGTCCSATAHSCHIVRRSPSALFTSSAIFRLHNNIAATIAKTLSLPRASLLALTALVVQSPCLCYIGLPNSHCCWSRPRWCHFYPSLLGPLPLAMAYRLMLTPGTSPRHPCLSSALFSTSPIFVYPI